MFCGLTYVKGNCGMLFKITFCLKVWYVGLGFFCFVLGYGCISWFFSTHCVQQVCFWGAGVVMKTTQIWDTDEAELVEMKICC